MLAGVSNSNWLEGRIGAVLESVGSKKSRRAAAQRELHI
jgi:hypothetical protein